MLLVFVAPSLVVLVLLGPGFWHDITSVFGSRGMLASLCIVVLSVATGYALGGPQRSYRRTLSIGTGLRNIGLCASIATVSFKGGLVAASVMTYLIMQVLVCGLAGAYFKNTAKPEHEHEPASGMNFTPQAFEQQFSLSAIGVMGVVSLIAATTNAFNGASARAASRPLQALYGHRRDHLGLRRRHRRRHPADILVNRVPSPLINPWYIILCLGAAVVALVCDYYARCALRTDFSNL